MFHNPYQGAWKGKNQFNREEDKGEGRKEERSLKIPDEEEDERSRRSRSRRVKEAGGAEGAEGVE